MRRPRSSSVSRPAHRQSSPHSALLTAAVTAALAASVPAQLQFEELPRKQLPIDNDVTAAVALGDVDGDGDLDMVVGNGGWNNGQQNRLYLNNGTGTFTDATTARMPVDADRTSAVALGDVDGDGDLDIVIGNSGPQNRLYLNNGINSGTFTDATAARMPVVTNYTLAVALGDVDGDGDLDIVWGNNGQNRLYLNNGIHSGTFTDATAQIPVVIGATSAVALGDVDGDTDLDIVFGNYYHQNRLYLNSGTGTFTDVTATQMPIDFDETAAASLGDVDTDGDLDLVLGNGSYYGAQSRLYLNDGSGGFSDTTALRMPVDVRGTTSVALGDGDGDGDLDMFLGSYGIWPPGPNRLYLNDGLGSFANATTARMPTGLDQTLALALGDVDRDGDLDAVFGNDGQSRLNLNLLRQLDTATPPTIGQNYTLDAYMRYVQPTPITFALPYVSFDSASIALPPYGTIGIDPAQAVALPMISIPQPAGVGSLNLSIVNDPGLVGLSIYSQALLVPYPYQERLSNVVSDLLQ